MTSKKRLRNDFKAIAQRFSKRSRNDFKAIGTAKRQQRFPERFRTISERLGNEFGATGATISK
jgi:hypothetical protein